MLIFTPEFFASFDENEGLSLCKERNYPGFQKHECEISRMRKPGASAILQAIIEWLRFCKSPVIGNKPNIHIISIAMETFIMHPEISVIVPTPNEGKYPKRTLASIANQNTNTPYELIVADSESTSESRSITDKVLNPTLPGFNICVRKDAYVEIGGYRNVPLEGIEFSRRISQIGKTGYFDDVVVITSPRRLDGMGLLGTLYYYAQLDLGRVIDGSMIDKMSKKLGIANLRDYMGLR